MVTVKEMVENLLELGSVAQDMEIYVTHGASGVTYETSSVHIDKVTGKEECGPFLDKGTKYVSLYVGN